MLLVAYPDYGSTTEFEFKYWVDSYTPPPATIEELINRILNGNFKGADGTDALIVAIVSGSIALCLLLIIICCICKFCCHKKNKL